MVAPHRTGAVLRLPGNRRSSPCRVRFTCQDVVKSEEKHTIISEALKSNAMLKGAIESGFTAKPVSFTAAITTAVLFAVSQSI
jgi:hypothetical protein